MAVQKETIKLCGAAYDPADPRSPRCVLAKNQHGGRPHEALGVDGKAIFWNEGDKPAR